MTTAEADLLASAVLVAVTLKVPALLGATYRPLLVTVPPDADQVTPVLVVPDTDTANCCCAPLGRFTVPGETEIDTCAGCVTVTTAESDLLASAVLVAVTLKVPALLGATYWPPVVTVPPEDVQVTAVLVVPLTVAVNWVC